MAQKKFRLGISMAGAVSAGAYTAGVMDYLIEVLEKWETAKAKNREVGSDSAEFDSTVPMHDVEIDVLSGASAGGMTAVIAAAGLQQNFAPVKPQDRNNQDLKSKNPFYNTWVNLTRDDMLVDLFDNGDIKKGEGVISLLNSSFKEKIAERVIQPSAKAAYARPYIAERMEVIVSLSNLNGIPFDIGFKGNAEKTNLYRTTSHRDYAHFVLNASYKNDGRMPISFSEGTHLDVLRQSAMATGAFPIGLAARRITRESKFLSDNPYINPLYGEPSYRLSIADRYETLNSDGGLLNNEPFDLTYQILMDKTKQSKKASEDHNKFMSTVLMVDPFPSEPENLESTKTKKLNAGVLSVVGLLVNTMRSELSFKRESLEVAYSDDNYSRFLVSPKRTGVGGFDYQGNMAIACGSLGGFGGFFEKSFREHDFYLGRRNAQYFLRKHFAIPADSANPIIMAGYSDEAKDRFEIKTRRGKTFIPIIPDLAYDKNDISKNSEPLDPSQWPKFPASKFKEIEKPIVKRLQLVILELANLSGLFRALGWVGIQIFKKKISTLLLGVIRKDFEKRDLLG